MPWENGWVSEWGRGAVDWTATHDALCTLAAHNPDALSHAMCYLFHACAIFGHGRQQHSSAAKQRATRPSHPAHYAPATHHTQHHQPPTHQLPARFLLRRRRRHARLVLVKRRHRPVTTLERGRVGLVTRGCVPVQGLSVSASCHVRFMCEGAGGQMCATEGHVPESERHRCHDGCVAAMPVPGHCRMCQHPPNLSNNHPTSVLLFCAQPH